MNRISQSDLIMEFFKSNPNRDVAHPEIVDWATAEYQKRTCAIFRDPDRAIRKLHQNGYLIKASKGVYRYDPNFIRERNFEDFSETEKQYILSRDDFRCVICGRGEREGIDLHVDHIKPKDKGGQATIENGQTLCAQHNFKKKTYNQTETGKKMFLRLYNLAKVENDEEIKDFCKQILEVFEKNNINGHIAWKK